MGVLDDNSNRDVRYLMKNKSDILETLKEYYEMATMQHEKKVKFLMCDGEYAGNGPIKEFRTEKGIKIQGTNPYTMVSQSETHLNAVRTIFSRLTSMKNIGAK